MIWKKHDRSSEVLWTFKQDNQEEVEWYKHEVENFNKTNVPGEGTIKQKSL